MSKLRILSVDGGGYLGLATASFIRGIEDHFSVRFSEHFDLFCGTSTGGILALAIANGRTGQELVDLYLKLGPRVFPATSWLSRKTRGLRSLLFAKYSNAGLRDVLRQEFGNKTLGDLRAADRNILVTAFCLTTGAPRLFKTDHSESLSLHDQYSLVDVALASASAPIFLPLVEITNPKNGVKEVFCDGGVAANHPALLGFAEALSELSAKPSDIQVLSLGTPRIDLATPRRSFRTLSRGILLWRDTLASAFIDSNAFLADEILRRVARSYPEPRPLYARIKMQNRHCLPMDLTSRDTSGILLQLGADQASSNDVRAQLRPFFERD